MPSWVPSQAQHSCFMCALDLCLENIRKCEWPRCTSKAVPACTSCQYVQRHKISWPQLNGVCCHFLMNTTQIFPSICLKTASYDSILMLLHNSQWCQKRWSQSMLRQRIPAARMGERPASAGCCRHSCQIPGGPHARGATQRRSHPPDGRAAQPASASSWHQIPAQIACPQHRQVSDKLMWGITVLQCMPQPPADLWAALAVTSSLYLMSAGTVQVLLAAAAVLALRI